MNFLRMRETVEKKGVLKTRSVRRVALMAVASLLVVSAAQSDEFDDYIAALNALVMQAGPIPGSIAADLPKLQADAEQAAEGASLSISQSNTPHPENANQFAFETHDLNVTEEVTGENLNLTTLQDNGKIDVPTGAAPSPIFNNAQPFTQQMLRFEEFGPVPLGSSADVVSGDPFPSPADAESAPDSTALDDYLKQYVSPLVSLPYPYPTRMANDPDHGGSHENPWKQQIESYLGRSLNTPPAEGRPPGESWAHQRWAEFMPEVYVTTAQAGARDNNGNRDQLQSHHYNTGEFAPGGLYHNITGNPGSDGTADGVAVQFHPEFPVQHQNALWTWDGTFPPKLLQARYGEPILLRHYNALPIDPSSNYGFGAHTITTHEHNGHSPSESDGYTQAFFFPGQFYDYRWPMVIAGHDSINTDANDPRAGAPDGSGGIKNLPGDWRETMSTHWFHDHMLDFTATNVYKGNAAMMNYYSSLDRGNEALEDGVNLRFPSGSGLDWGNRDYDVNLFIKGIAWDAEGQLWFNIFNTDGMLGDRLVTNWLWKPYLDVRARRYRFRILNGSVSRYIRLALVEEVQGGQGELRGEPGSGVSYNRVPFHMIANDGNIMEHAVHFDGNKTVGGLTNTKGILPSQGIAERYDIVVDFAQFAPGTKLYMVNLLEHHNGRRPHQAIPLADVLDGSYAPEVVDGRNETDTTVTKFLEFRVQACSKADGSPAANCVEGGDAVLAQQDRSMNPAEFVEGGKKMVPLPGFTEEELANATHRTFEFGRSNGTDGAPWTIKTDGGAGFNMDPRRLSAAPVRDGAVEIWHLTTGGGWSHPIHVHFEEGQILKRGGVDPPEWEQWARKDVYRIGRLADSTHSVDFAIRFREFMGQYMEHCHNTQHEDHAMLLRWDIENPGQVRVMPTPMPSWDGVGYVPSYAVETYKVGDVSAAADVVTVDKAWFTTRRSKWDVRGTSSVVGASITITLGPTAGGTVVGTAAVNQQGNWVYNQGLGVDPDGATTISLESSAGGVVEAVPIEFR